MRGLAMEQRRGPLALAGRLTLVYALITGRGLRGEPVEDELDNAGILFDTEAMGTVDHKEGDAASPVSGIPDGSVQGDTGP